MGSKTSHAYEIGDRTTLDTKFATVEYGGQVDYSVNANPGTDHKGKIKFGNNPSYGHAQAEKENIPVSDVYEKYTMRARTYVSHLNQKVVYKTCTHENRI